MKIVNCHEKPIAYASMLVFALMLGIASSRSSTYLGSVMLGMGTMTFALAIAYVALAKTLEYRSIKDLKVLVLFCAFSNTMTCLLEQLMLGFDVWAFGNQDAMLGYVFLGAPIEEYVYWFFCPLIVGLSYLILKRPTSGPLRAKQIQGGIEDVVTWLERHRKQIAKQQDAVKYTVPGSNNRYSRGSWFPVYLFVQLSILACILFLLKYLVASWKYIACVAVLFFAIAFPHEFNSTGNHYWVYNSTRELGVFWYRVPIEGWIMYFLAPVCGCVIIDAIASKVK